MVINCVEITTIYEFGSTKGCVHVTFIANKCGWWVILETKFWMRIILDLSPEKCILCENITYI